MMAPRIHSLTGKAVAAATGREASRCSICDASSTASPSPLVPRAPPSGRVDCNEVHVKPLSRWRTAPFSESARRGIEPRLTDSKSVVRIHHTRKPYCSSMSMSGIEPDLRPSQSRVHIHYTTQTIAPKCRKQSNRTNFTKAEDQGLEPRSVCTPAVFKTAPSSGRMSSR